MSRFVEVDNPYFPDCIDEDDEDIEDLDDAEEDASIIEDDTLFLADEDDIIDPEDDEEGLDGDGGEGADVVGAGGGGGGALEAGGWAFASSSCPSALASVNKNMKPKALLLTFPVSPDDVSSYLMLLSLCLDR